MAGCGGAEDETAATTASTRTVEAEGATYDVTVGEFLVALEPEKITMIEDFAEDNPQDCKGVEANDSLALLATRALDTPPDTPLPEFLLAHCKASP